MGDLPTNNVPSFLLIPEKSGSKLCLVVWYKLNFMFKNLVCGYHKISSCGYTLNYVMLTVS